MKPANDSAKNKAFKALALKFNLCIPPGTSLSDFFIDGSQVVQELFITKRTLLNWRGSGKVSYTDEFGKIFYFKQEIAAILLGSKKRAGMKAEGKVKSSGSTGKK